MAQAKSISLSKFTETVQGAVKAAVEKHPKFKGDLPKGVAFSYLIRGIPWDERVLANVTLGETQAFADELAANIGAQAEFAAAAGSKPKGVILSTGGHVILGFPPVDTFVLEK
jgi:hypothetical protein